MEPIRKNNYRLRPWETDDFLSLAEHFNNIHIWNQIRDLPFPYGPEDAKAFIAFAQSRTDGWDFALEIDGRAVGNISFASQPNVERFNAEVGYWIAEPFWNRGIVSDALHTAAEWIFSHTPVIRLYAHVYELNPASRRVLEKAGFRSFGKMEKAVFKNGQFLDVYAYERLKPGIPAPAATPSGEASAE